MEKLTEIKVHNNKIIINGEIIYDFEDRYRNISALGVEQQIKIYSQIIKMISETNLSTSEKSEFILICTYLFKILSAKNAPAAILTIGNNRFISIIAEINDLFNNANKLYYICDNNNYNPNNNINNLISIVTNKFCDTDFLAGNSFDAILIDLNFTGNNIHAVLSDCNRLLARKGSVICYGSDVFRSEISNIFLTTNVKFYQLSEERFAAYINIDDNSVSTNSVKEEILSMIKQKNSELIEKLQYIMSNRPISLNDRWYSIIDDCIFIIDQIESIIAKNYMLFENEDLKYQTNEVKNALLDFKYEAYLNRKHYDFFQANLFDCYNDWVTNISNEIL